MNERLCYCPADDIQPAYLQQRGIPKGYCGICERCGGFGHTRHFPGPLPYTGAWCDACYQIVAFQSGLRDLIIKLGVLSIMVVVVRQFKRWISHP